MRRQDGEAIPFPDYLDAKFALDDRSLNEQVRSAMIVRLRGKARLVCLDVGSGTGAMVRRLLHLSQVPELLITVLDSNRDILATARRRIAGELQQLRLAVDENGAALRAESIGRTVVVDFVACRVSEFSPPALRYDLITAHAFMDLVAIDSTLASFEHWLVPGGLLYATLNYDGFTSIYPPFEDGRFESQLMAVYDASMDSRRVNGEATGGSRSGSRLITALLERRWEVLAYGSSDWNLTPLAGHYRDRDSVCMQALLEFIRVEAERSSLDWETACRWSTERAQQLAASRLGMIVHQVDVLAAMRA
jgi:SAM-dependent methyltransferase